MSIRPRQLSRMGTFYLQEAVLDVHFDYKSMYDKEFKRCWDLKNLQPLWAIDNMRKGAKYEYIINS